jgi:hypothetical protein
VLDEQRVSGGGGLGLIVLQLHQGDGALVLHERTHQRGVGVERVARDNRSVECAGRQRLDQLVGEALFVARATLSQLEQRLAGLGVAEGDQGGEAAMKRLAIDRIRRLGLGGFD